MAHVTAIILVLLLNSLTCALMFYIMLNKKVSLWNALKLYCAAAALNKLIFTGSGYAAISWKLHKDGFPFARALFSFALLEFFAVIPWILLGFYSGATLVVWPPFLLLFLTAAALYAFYKRKYAADFFKHARSYCREIKFNFLFLAALASVNLALFGAYYVILCRAFRFAIPVFRIIKIVSVAFTVGYLSPIPSGLAVKESGMALLLHQQGIALKESFLFALADRLIVTALYAGLGFLIAAEIILDALKQKAYKG